MGCSCCGQKYNTGSNTAGTPVIQVVTPPEQRYNLSQPPIPAAPVVQQPVVQPPK